MFVIELVKNEENDDHTGHLFTHSGDIQLIDTMLYCYSQNDNHVFTVCAHTHFQALL